jgi:hypothetical protein
MFITLLIVTFFISLAVSVGSVYFFQSSLKRVLSRIVTEELADAWLKYIKFAAYVVGISGGVRIYQLELYVHPINDEIPIKILDSQAWILEVYSTIIETLQSIAWMLFIVFVVTLIAFVIVRAFELRKNK